jgi:Glycosyl transferases group 1
MKVLFIGRIDYPPKQGGDAVQMEAYKDGITKKGYKVEIASLTSGPDSYDFVHLFNISRIYDLVYQLNTKVKNEPILVLHPIHQKKEYLNRIKELIGRNAGNEKIKFIARNILSKKFKVNQLHYIFKNENELLQNLLRRINYFHFLSEKERDWFEKDCDFKVDDEKVIIFGNAVSHRIERLNSLQEREIDILIPGRIEPHKNNVNTARILSSFSDKKVVFAGQLNRYYKNYNKEFMNLIEQNENLDYVGSRDSFEMQQLYDNSKVIFSLSLSEVAPLIELEALAHKAIFIGTNRSASRINEDMNCCYHIDPENLNEAVNILNGVFEKIRTGFEFSFPHINSWEKEMEPLLNLYEKFERKN